MARLSAAMNATSSRSRPKRVANLAISERGVPTPGRTSTVGSRTASAIASASGAGSSAKRARRGAWSSPSTKLRIAWRWASRSARRWAPTIPADFGRNDVAVRVNGDEEAAPLEREADAAPRRRRAHRAAQAQRLALEIEQLLGVDLAADVLDGR